MTPYGGSSEFWGGARLMLPVALGDLLEGTAFGALAATVVGPIVPVAMSITAFSGSAQFATIAVLQSDGTLLAALLAAACLNVRYLAMGASVATSVTGSRWRKAAVCLVLTDASWAVMSSGRARPTGAGLVGAGSTELIAWTLGTVTGVLAGGVVGDVESLGLDAAFPALFVWLLLQDRVRGRVVAVATAGGVIALALSPLLAPGLPILVVGLIAGALGLRR